MMFDQAATGKMRTGPNPTVADFSLMISDRSIFKRYMRRENEKYFYLIVLMGVTYTLPVIQLVYKHQQDSIALGERETERDGARERERERDTDNVNVTQKSSSLDTRL